MRGETRVFRSVLALFDFNDTCNLQTYYRKFQFLGFVEIGEARLDFLQPGRGVAKLLARFCLFFASSPLTCTNMSLQSLSTYKCTYYTNIYFTDIVRSRTKATEFFFKYISPHLAASCFGWSSSSGSSQPNNFKVTAVN
jgi:hypothetical protein